MDLLRSNMETLLPLPLTQLTTSACKPQSKEHLPPNPKEQPPPTCVQSNLQPRHARLLHAAESADCSDDGSPVKISNRMRKNKRKHCLPDKDRLNSDSDSEDGFMTLCKPQGAPQPKEEVKERVVSKMVKKKPLTPEERLKNIPVSQCLESMADFLDNMSYTDSLHAHIDGGDIHRRAPPVGAVVKDGMTDESRVETDTGRWVGEEHVLEVQAAVEAISFHKCRRSIADAWDKAKQLEGELGEEAAAELTLPVAPHLEGHSFTQDGPCEPQ